MSGNSGLITLKERRHLVYRKPDSLVNQCDLYLGKPVSGLIKKDFSSIRCIATLSANHFLQRYLKALADANNNKAQKNNPPYLYL